MSELLIELFSEEIPARLQAKAAADLARAVNQRLLDAGFMPEGVKGFAGPRRLTVAVAGLPAQQPDRREEKKGPRVGAPEKAIAGFLKSAGLSSVDEAEKRSDKKGEYYVAVIDEKGRPTADLIAEFAPEIVTSFAWPKSMRWGDGDLRWVRPLQRILCVYDGEVVPFNVEGLAADDATEGHRIMGAASGDVIRARNFEKYEAALKKAHVILSADERAQIIAGEAKTLCEAQGFELVEDKGLLTETAGLAEWPVVMMGSFDEKFLTLPDEVLTASMRGHQKYFSVRDPKTGRLTNRFVVVANLEAPDGGAAMRQGYERVLTARLSDAWYLYRQDLKTRLADRITDLDRITFFEGLGSVGDKARRIAALSQNLAPVFDADDAVAARAGQLSKADLVTGMVFEFPELQGLMGRYYAEAQGETPSVADAIRDHYKPAGPDDPTPTEAVAATVAFADKIDTLNAFWAIDKKPTGSSDPFALRRAALAVLRLVFDNEVRLSLRDCFTSASEVAAATHPDRPLQADLEDLLGFLHDRLKVFLRDAGHRHDHINAVLTTAQGRRHDDLLLIRQRLSALEAFLKTDNGENLAAAYKRAANILKAEEKKGGVSARMAGGARMDKLDAPEEKILYDALIAAEEETTKAIEKEDFELAMATLSTLRAPIDDFFERVTVNAEDDGLRTNRLALLDQFITATTLVADFAVLEG